MPEEIARPRRGAYAIRAARWFDGVGQTLRNDVQVVVEGSTIVSVGAPHELAADVEVLDLGDVTLLPGLVDAHTHLTWNAQPDAVARLSVATDDALLEQARSAAAAALRVGITTVRDLGDKHYVTLTLRDETRADPARGPHVVAAGPPVTTRLGHCGFLGGEAETDHELRAAVSDRVERGVDVIKVMATGGNVTPGCKPPEESQYTRRQLALLADAAHRAGVPVTAHAHGAEGALDAVLSGYDAIEHGGFWTATGAEISAESVDLLAAKGTYVVATPATRGLMDLTQLPPALARRRDAMMAVARAQLAGGVRMVYASDAGVAPPKPHDVLAYSLTAAYSDGWPPAQILRAMTSDAAAVCGLGGTKGRIAAGYDADLLAVHGDPFTHPEALADTRAVFRLGELVRDTGPPGV
jgi:imidazolonepropionase-like amidohydrolase